MVELKWLGSAGSEGSASNPRLYCRLLFTGIPASVPADVVWLAAGMLAGCGDIAWLVPVELGAAWQAGLVKKKINI